MAELALIVVSPIIDQIVTITRTLIQEEFLLVLGVKDDVEKLSSNLTAIQATLKYAEDWQLNEEHCHLKDWLRKLKDAADDAVDILDTFRTEACLRKRKHKIGNILNPPISAAHEIKEILSRLNMICEEKQNFLLNISVDGGISPLYKRPPTDYFVDKSVSFLANILQSHVA